MTKGILLINLGTPAAPTKSAVSRYLREFLLDPYVVNRPWWLRYPLVCGLIVPLRIAKAVKAYRSIWTAQGSPLLLHSQQLQRALKQRLGDTVPVELAMRYGEPSITKALTALKNQGVTTVQVMPLYPQSTQSSTLTAVAKARAAAAKLGLELDILAPFYDRPEFITAHHALLAPALAAHNYDAVLFSFHGIPEEHLLAITPQCRGCLENGKCQPIDANEPEGHRRDCYRWQCYQTAHIIAQAVGLASSDYVVAFQSRIGRLPWIKPYTDTILGELVATGKKKILVVCPAFTADCLETLEEMGVVNRQRFLAGGGERYDLVPCLNASDTWVWALAQWFAYPPRN